jgi:hypothetical protein
MNLPFNLPFPLPPLEALMLRSRPDALSALLGAGWRPYATPIGLDAERRRLLNIDLSEPEAGWLDSSGDLAAVARFEVDRAGEVTLVEITGASPVPPEDLARAWLGEPGEPRVAGGVEAREWVWGPESGAESRVGSEPVRLWVCAEQAYGGRLWAVASLVRRAG